MIDRPLRIGDRIRRTWTDGASDIKEITTQRELDYYRSLQDGGLQISILPEISGGTCTSCEA